MRAAVPVIISSRNRAFYLWACLDALHRNTSAPRTFHLVDMCSDDPSVGKVLLGFERRELFSEVYRAPKNEARFLADFIASRLEKFGEYFAYIESDVIVPDLDPCWLAQMADLMDQNPKLVMLGSAIDKRDFVGLDTFDRLHDKENPEKFYALIKADSPERHQDLVGAGGAKLFRPHNPPGRLLLLRTAAVKEIGLRADTELDQKFIAAGYETAIATGVIHRHLSLTQIFDYPDYDLNSRNAHMQSIYSPRDSNASGD